MTHTDAHAPTGSTSEGKPANPYLVGPVPRLFFKTALPIIMVMIFQGLFTVIDAIFVGVYVGADALTAVTLMFPLFMAVVAMCNLVGTGMASVLARQLGAGDMAEAAATFWSAHGLALVTGLVATGLFVLWGRDAVALAADGNAAIAQDSYRYIAPQMLLIVFSIWTTINMDALRSEGHIQALAVISVGSAILNIAFNYILIALVGLGVLGSALGTVASGFVMIAVMLWLRLSGRTRLGFKREHLPKFGYKWGRMLLLGLPGSVNFLGVSITASITLLTLQVVKPDSYVDTAAAYGIITRISALTFLPLLGFNLAAQSITGNNIGARLFARSNAGLALALKVALIYASVVLVAIIAAAPLTGRLFVDDAGVIAEVARIQPVVFAAFPVFAVVLIISGYFQAVGDAARAGLLTLGKIYLFTIPICLTLPHVIGDWGLWLSGVIGDVAMLAVAVVLLTMTARKTGHRWGLFHPEEAT